MAQGVYLIGRARGANRSGAGVEGGTGRNTLIQRLAMAFSILNSSGRLHIAHLRILGLTLVSSVSAMCVVRAGSGQVLHILPKKPVSSPQRPRRNDRYLRQRQVCGRDCGSVVVGTVGRYLPRAQPPPGLRYRRAVRRDFGGKRERKRPGRSRASSERNSDRQTLLVWAN